MEGRDGGGIWCVCIVHGMHLSRCIPLLDGVGTRMRRCARPDQQVGDVRREHKGNFNRGGGRTRMGCFGLRLLLWVDRHGLLVPLLLQRVQCGRRLPQLPVHLGGGGGGAGGGGGWG